MSCSGGSLANVEICFRQKFEYVSETRRKSDPLFGLWSSTQHLLTSLTCLLNYHQAARAFFYPWEAFDYFLFEQNPGSLSSIYF